MIISGEKIVPDELMDCEELKNPVAKAFDNARKVMRTEDGIESEMESSESITLPPSVVSYPPWFH